MSPDVPTDASRIDHVAIEVSDFDAQVEHLTTRLGLTCGRIGRYGADTSRRIAMLRDDHGFKLELIEAPQKAEPSTQFRHVAWRVDDVDASFEQLVQSGYTVVSGPRDIAAARARSAHLVDEQGLAVQLISYAPDSPDL